MKRRQTAGMLGGTRPTPDIESGREVDPPAIIDPAEKGNCPMPCDPHADPRLFGGDLAAALAHKWRPYLDLFGYVWTTNAGPSLNPERDRREYEARGLTVGEPRPTTSTEGTLGRLKEAGIFGVYRKPATAD